MTLDEVSAHIAKLEAMIEQSRALLESAQSVQEAEIERDNLAQFEQALTLLQRQRAQLLQNG